MEFMRQYPDDAACLDYLWRTLYAPDGKHFDCPTCGVERTFHRVASRPMYSCAKCGKAIYPTAGTIFEKSSTSLHLWFYGIYLMSSTRCGISAKQLERELGVTYKTAWRMFNKIRSVLGQDDPERFDGPVEVDEAYIGGLSKWRTASRSKAMGVRVGRGDPNKQPVMGVAQRKSADSQGKVYVKVVAGVSERDLLPHIGLKVLPHSVVYTDEMASYQNLGERGYKHSRVPHGAQVYVDGDVHTNTIDGFWSHLKGGISGVYHGVSTRYLQNYLDEFVFRYNNREAVSGMFNAFLDRVTENAQPRVTFVKPSEAQS